MGGASPSPSPPLWDLSILVLDRPSSYPEPDWLGLAGDVDDVAFMADWDTWASASLASGGDIVVLESATVVLESATLVLESVAVVLESATLVLESVAVVLESATLVLEAVTAVLDWVSVDALV